VSLLDSHCHLDRYTDAQGIAEEAGRRGVFTIAVTNLPSHFKAGLPHVGRLPRVRLALGLHPLAAHDHERELPAFEQYFSATSFIGEVGLDLSKEGKDTESRQLQSFRQIVSMLAASPRIVSLHSRGAEAEVLGVLSEFGVTGAIFHWYSGSLNVLDQLIESGHLVSVNPAMTRSSKGRAIIQRVPCDRVLTETDGPYVRMGGSPAHPWDVVAVETHLAKAWNMPCADVRAKVWSNFLGLLANVRSRL
jgi:TatD DNase family protein